MLVCSFFQMTNLFSWPKKNTKKEQSGLLIAISILLNFFGQAQMFQSKKNYHPIEKLTVYFGYSGASLRIYSKNTQDNFLFFFVGHHCSSNLMKNSIFFQQQKKKWFQTNIELKSVPFWNGIHFVSIQAYRQYLRECDDVFVWLLTWSNVVCSLFQLCVCAYVCTCVRSFVRSFVWSFHTPLQIMSHDVYFCLFRVTFNIFRLC